MADLTMYPARSRAPETHLLFGTVTIGGSGAVSSQDCDGMTVAITGDTGEYTVTLGGLYSQLLYADVQTVVGTDAFSLWSVDAEAVASTGVIRIRHASQSTATHVAAWPPNGAVLKIVVAVKNTTVKP